MDETIHYPIQDLQTTTTTQGKMLLDTWQAHCIHIDQYILQPASQLSGAGGDTFQSHMTTWSQNLEKYYTALTAFTNLLHTGATKMDTLDQQIGQNLTSDI